MDVSITAFCVVLVDFTTVEVAGPLLEVDKSGDANLTDELVGVDPKVLLFVNVIVDCLKLEDAGVEDVSPFLELEGKGDAKVTVALDGVFPEDILVGNVVVDCVDVKDVDVGDVGVDVQGFCVGFGLIVELPSEEKYIFDLGL